MTLFKIKLKANYDAFFICATDLEALVKAYPTAYEIKQIQETILVINNEIK